MDPTTPQGFAQLVTQLLSADNAARAQAEAVFNQVKQHPDSTAANLLAVMRSAPDVEHRSFAAIMMRKVCLPAHCLAPSATHDATLTDAENAFVPGIRAGVACMTRISTAISVCRTLTRLTSHSLLLPASHRCW